MSNGKLTVHKSGGVKMKSGKLFLVPGIALVLMALLVPCQSQGQLLAPMLMQALSDLKRDLPRYNENIRMSEATVNAIIDEMDGVPSAGGRSPNEQIRDLKEGIKGNWPKPRQTISP
jgi:hypothetical protein